MRRGMCVKLLLLSDMCVCVIRASDHVFTLTLKENVSFVCMGQLKCCNPGQSCL